jgi:hypothetical protein
MFTDVSEEPVRLRQSNQQVCRLLLLPCCLGGDCEKMTLWDPVTFTDVSEGTVRLRLSNQQDCRVLLLPFCSAYASTQILEAICSSATSGSRITEDVVP